MDTEGRLNFFKYIKPGQCGGKGEPISDEVVHVGLEIFNKLQEWNAPTHHVWPTFSGGVIFIIELDVMSFVEIDRDCGITFWYREKYKPIRIVHLESIEELKTRLAEVGCIT